MLWEDYRGNERQVTWGELQDASSRLASVLGQHGVEPGDRVAMLLTPRPETAAAFLGDVQGGRGPAVPVGPLRRRGDPAPRDRLGGEGARHQRREHERVRALGLPVEHVLVLDEHLHRGRRPALRADRHPRRRPRPAVLHLGHDRAREGDPPRAPVPPGAQRVRAQPRHTRGRALPRDGRVGLGGGHRAAPRAVAVRSGAGRVRAGRADSIARKQLAFLSKYEVTNVFSTPTAIRR